MNVKKNQLDKYKRFLLNRLTTNNQFIELVENCLTSEDEAAAYCFHKLMVHNWPADTETLYDLLMSYFNTTFIPVNGGTHGDITVFYTSSLQIVLKILKFDFMFPYQRNMFNIDILFYAKTSEELLDNNIKIDDIISGVVSRRFSAKQELDLSNFCNEPEFQEKNISFYKLSLLSYFKLLMIRIGRDTKELNLSNNNLSQPPLEILNFFIKGDLTAINLSYNNIASLSDLIRVSSKIEKLWLEGNPLCEDMDPMTYVKSLTTKFPRLRELDGIELNINIVLPFIKNYVPGPNKILKMFLEKFLMLYFSHYDSPKRKNIYGFYDPHATLTVTTKLNDTSEGFYNRNPRRFKDQSFPTNNVYVNLDSLYPALMQLPPTVHDPTSFTVDVLYHDKRMLIVIVDGIFKETEILGKSTRYFQFRRTFVFKLTKNNYHTTYHIVNELYSITNATEEQIRHSFKYPIGNMSSLSLVDPDQEEKNIFIKIFMNLTQLKKEEAEARLVLQNWVLPQAIEEFTNDVRLDKISQDKFLEDDEFSDLSSLIDDEID